MGREDEYEERIPPRFEQKEGMSELMREIMKPDLAKDNDFLTKELKISNIKRADLDFINEITDIALQWKDVGAKDFAKFLITLRDVHLSATSSVDGFERTMEVTDIQKEIFKEDSKKGTLGSIFKRGEKNV